MISSLPAGDEVAIVTFTARAELRLTPTLITEANRAGVYSRIPGKVNNQ